MKRGQAGIEYVIMVGLLLFFLVPILSYSVTEANLNIRINQIENAMGRVTRAANTVYGLGPGSMQVVTITVPSGIISSSIQGKEVVYVVSMFGKTSDVYYPTKIIVNGTMPTKPGTYRIAIRTLDTGLVDIRPWI